MSLKIVVPDDFPAAFTGSSAEPRLRGLGTVTVHTERGADQEAELIRRIGDAEVVINIRAHARFTDRVLAGCPSLRLISIWGTGTDNVDLAACRTRGVAVTNTPGRERPRRRRAHARAHAGHHAPHPGDGPRHAGGPVAARAAHPARRADRGPDRARRDRRAGWRSSWRPFGVRLLAATYGPDAGRAAAAGARHVPVETLLRESDIVSLHLRLSADTQSYLGRDRLALMKPTAFLINTARGGLVDKAALVDALRDGRIAGAALDVFHEEPIPAGDPILGLAERRPDPAQRRERRAR